MLAADEELNAQVLAQMREGGDDLSAIRPLVFQFVFQTRELAQRFAEDVVKRDLQAVVSDVGDGPAADLPWDVDVTVALRPELAAISSHERELGQMADAYQGRGDGWFCERITRDERVE